MRKERAFNLVLLFCLVSTMFLGLWVPGVSASDVMGNYNFIGSTTVTYGSGLYTYYFGPYTAPVSGYITQAVFYGYDTGTPVNHFAAVYNVSGGAPSYKIGSFENLESGSVSLKNFTFTATWTAGVKINVTAGTQYYLAMSMHQYGYNARCINTGYSEKCYTQSGNLSSPASGTLQISVAKFAVWANIFSESLTYTMGSMSGYGTVAQTPFYSCAWTTNNTLSHFCLESNITGSATNSSWTAFSAAPWSNYTGASIPLDGAYVGRIVGYRFFANTTSGLLAASALSTFVVAGTPYMITGPYIEDNGYVYNGVISGSVSFSDGTKAAFSLNGTTGAAQTYLINPAYTPIAVTWQPIANYSYTRVYYLTDTTQCNVTVLVPNPAASAQIYQFTVSDFYGVTNPFVSSSKLVGGNLTSREYTIERKPLTVGSVSLIMEQWQTYYFNVDCDQGTYTITFSAEGSFQTNINIPAGAFPLANYSLPVLQAARLNSTAIGIVYSDSSELTTSLAIVITHKEGLVTYTDYSGSWVSDSLSLIWNSGDPELDYYVNATAVSDGNTYRFKIIIPVIPPANPFDGLLDFLGPSIDTIPVHVGGFPAGVDPAQLLAGVLIMAALCLGSFRSAGSACLIAWGVGGIMIVIGWWQGAIPIWSFAGIISILILIDEWRTSNGGMMAT